MFLIYYLIPKLFLLFSEYSAFINTQLIKRRDNNYVTLLYGYFNICALVLQTNHQYRLRNTLKLHRHERQFDLSTC